MRILTVILHCVLFVSIEGMARQKRHSLYSRSSCTTSQSGKIEYCMDTNRIIYPYNCKWTKSTCYYLLSCTSSHNCRYSGHVTRNYCCYYRCKLLEKSCKELVSLPITCSGLSDTAIAGTWTSLDRIARLLIILHYCILYMSKGLFTRGCY